MAAWPLLIDQMIDFMAQNRELVLLHSRNPSAFEALARTSATAENQVLEARLARILCSPAIPLRERVRMAAITGVITEVFVESGAAFADVPPAQLAALIREAIADLVPGEVGSRR